MDTDRPIQRLKATDIIEGRVLQHTKIRFLKHAGVQDLEEFDTGVFFILAWWSGPAHVGLDHLARAILKTDPDGRIDLLIADTDGAAELYNYDFLRGNIHGYGECIFKKGRKVVGTLLRLGEIREYQERILKILG
jgi:hypothetical protein